MEHALEEEPFAHEAAEGGKGGNGQPPTKKTVPLTGIRARRPPSPSRSVLPDACWMELAERNSEPLNTA